MPAFGRPDLKLAPRGDEIAFAQARAGADQRDRALAIGRPLLQHRDVLGPEPP